MNWILLILAGCLELVFTFCLGKNKQSSRSREIYVVIRAADIPVCQYAPSDKGYQSIARWYGLWYMDRYRCRRYGADRYLFL